MRSDESHLLIHDIPVNGNLVSHRTIRPELYDARRGLLERAGAGCATDSGFFDRTVHGVGTGSWGAFSAQLTKKNCLNQPSVLAAPTIGSYRPLVGSYLQITTLEQL